MTARRGRAPQQQAPAATAADATAGGCSLGLKHPEDVEQVIRQLKAGLPYRTLTRFQHASQLSLQEIARVIQVPVRTLARRREQGKLKPDESERLLRLSRLFDLAVELFEGDVAAARGWLNTPNRAFGDQTPLVMAETEIGAREVEDLIGRLEHGVFA